ncbi:hypothetical protein Tco_0527837 [Tanacetum coccineum]
MLGNLESAYGFSGENKLKRIQRKLQGEWLVLNGNHLYGKRLYLLGCTGDDVLRLFLGCVMDTLKFTVMPFRLTNAPAVFMELMSRSKEEYESYVKMIVESLMEENMYMKFSNNVEAEQRGSYLDVEGIKWHAWKMEKVIACTLRQLKVLMKDCMANVFDFEAKYHLGKANVDVVLWSRKKE